MDIELIETFDGGDFVLKEVQDESGVFHDLQLDGGMTTAIYLSHFGGNVDASTTGNETPGTLRGDWWGNALIPDEPAKQANSGLERALLELPLNSGNLLKIEDRARADLSWMVEERVTKSIDSEALLIAPEKVKIIDTVEESQADTDFNAYWEYDKNKVLEEAS